jgi:hypothetical protein
LYIWWVYVGRRKFTVIFASPYITTENTFSFDSFYSLATENPVPPKILKYTCSCHAPPLSFSTRRPPRHAATALPLVPLPPSATHPRPRVATTLRPSFARRCCPRPCATFRHGPALLRHVTHVHVPPSAVDWPSFAAAHVHVRSSTAARPSSASPCIYVPLNVAARARPGPPSRAATALGR